MNIFRRREVIKTGPLQKGVIYVKRKECQNEICHKETRTVEATFCTQCGEVHGYNINETFVKRCSHCGCVQKLSNKFCSDCGYPFNQNITNVLTYVKHTILGGIIMFKNYILPAFGILVAIITIIVSALFLPLVMGAWATAVILGSVVAIIGLVFFIVAAATTGRFNWMKPTKFATFFSGLGIVVLAFAIWGTITLSQSFASQYSGNIAKAPAATNEAAFGQEDSAPAESSAAAASESAAPIPATTQAAVSLGLDQCSKSWFLAKAGTLVSGDVAIFDNDNNSKKTPVYDSKESTADVIYLTSDTYVWTEWGCYTIENATVNDVAALINDKLNNASGNFRTIRFFNGYSKLGTNLPVMIDNKVDPATITLPTITTTTK